MINNAFIHILYIFFQIQPFGKVIGSIYSKLWWLVTDWYYYNPTTTNRIENVDKIRLYPYLIPR